MNIQAKNNDSPKGSQMNDIHNKYIKWMKVVLRRAKDIGRYEIPVCALILDKKGRIIGRGSNRREICKDPLGHAELVALRQAAWLRGDWRFNDCTLIVNLEPCTMCAAAIIQARVGKIIYSNVDKKRGGFGGSINLVNHKSAHHNMDVYKGIMEDESANILKLWFKKLRKGK